MLPYFSILNQVDQIGCDAVRLREFLRSKFAVQPPYFLNLLLIDLCAPMRRSARLVVTFALSAIAHVLALSSGVNASDAVIHIALVKDALTAGYLAFRNHVADAMNVNEIIVNSHSGISNLVECPGPCPATSFGALTRSFIDVGPKALEDLWREFRNWYKIAAGHLISFIDRVVSLRLVTSLPEHPSSLPNKICNNICAIHAGLFQLKGEFAW